jgi:hypothetical protein
LDGKNSYGFQEDLGKDLTGIIYFAAQMRIPVDSDRRSDLIATAIPK